MATGDRIEIVGGVDWRRYTPFRRHTVMSAIPTDELPTDVYTNLFSVTGGAVLTMATIGEPAQLGNAAYLRIVIDGEVIFENLLNYRGDAPRNSGIVHSSEASDSIIPNPGSRQYAGRDLNNYDLPFLDGESNTLIVTPFLIESKESIEIDIMPVGSRDYTTLVATLKGGLKK